MSDTLVQEKLQATLAEAGLTPDPIQLGQTSLYRFMNRITSPWNPFDGEMEARDWKASARDDINEIIIHQAELEFGPYGSMQPEQLREIVPEYTPYLD